MILYVNVVRPLNICALWADSILFNRTLHFCRPSTFIHSFIQSLIHLIWQSFRRRTHQHHWQGAHDYPLWVRFTIRFTVRLFVVFGQSLVSRRSFELDSLSPPRLFSFAGFYSLVISLYYHYICLYLFIHCISLHLNCNLLCFLKLLTIQNR